MASGNGYDSELKLSVAPFTKEQRQRLEAITAARALCHASLSQPADVTDWLRVSRWITKGVS